MVKRDLTVVFAIFINVLLFGFLIFNIYKENLTLIDVINYPLNFTNKID